MLQRARQCQSLVPRFGTPFCTSWIMNYEFYNSNPINTTTGRLGVSPIAPPDWPCHNFRASQSEDWRIPCKSGTSCHGFQSSKIVKGSVGQGSVQQHMNTSQREGFVQSRILSKIKVNQTADEVHWKMSVEIEPDWLDQACGFSSKRRHIRPNLKKKNKKTEKTKIICCTNIDFHKTLRFEAFF